MTKSTSIIKYIFGALILAVVVFAIVLTVQGKGFNQGASFYKISDLKAGATLVSGSGATAANNLLPCSTGNTTPTLKVISPNGGENYQAGQQITVKWSTCNIPATGNVISIQLRGGFPGSAVNFMELAPSNYSINDGTETVTLPTQAINSFMQYGNNFKIKVWIEGYAQDESDNLFTINGAGPVAAACNAQAKVILIPEETSSDEILASKVGVNQEIARFWLYSPCDITIRGFHNQPFGPYAVSNGQGLQGYTFWGANRFNQFSLHGGFDTNSPVLGTVSYGGIGASADIVLNSPLQLTAGMPRAISISGKLKAVNQVSGTVLDRGQFCISDPFGVTDINGNTITVQQPLTSSGNSGNFFGRFTCGDIFHIY